MHELGLTQEIVGIATQASGGAKIVRIRLAVGMLAAVHPEALQFCFDLCSAGSPAAGATLEIINVPGRGRCRVCATEVALVRPFGTCPCGSSDLEWLAGDELKIQAVEVE